MALYGNSDGNATASLTARPPGIWLVEETQGFDVVLFGEEAPDIEIGESATEYTVIGRRDVVRVVDAVRGYEGSVSGYLGDYGDTLIETYRSRLEKIKLLGSKARVRLIIGELNIPITVGSMTLSPQPIRESTSVWRVEIDFWQSDEFPKLT